MGELDSGCEIAGVQLLDAHQLDFELGGGVGIDTAVENAIGKAQLAGGVGRVEGAAADEGEGVDCGEQRVVQRVARTIGGASAIDIQTLDVVAEGVGRQVAVHAVDPTRHRIAVDLDHGVVGVVDIVGVVAIASGHGVGAQVTIQCVIARTARQGIRLVGTGNQVPSVVENVLHAVVVVGVALEAKVIGNVVGQALADDLRRFLVQVPDVVGIRHWIDFVAQGKVGVVHCQIDVGALGGDGFLGGVDIANPLDDGGNLFFRITTGTRRVLLVVTGFHHVHSEVAELGMQVIKHLQGRRCCRCFVRAAADLLGGFLALAPNDAHGDQHRGAGLIVVLRHAQQARIGLAEGGQVEDALLGALAEHEVAAGQGAGEVAREHQLEAIAVGVGIVVLDVGAVAAGAVADLQGTAMTIAQAGETETGEVDLVLSDVEVGDGVIEACGCVEVTVGLNGETERIGAGTAGEFVDACRTLHGGHRHRVADVAAVAIDQRGTIAGVADGVANNGVAIGAVFVAFGDAVGRQVAAGDDVALDGVIAAVEVLAGHAQGVVVGLDDDLRYGVAQGVVVERVVDDLDVVAAVDADPVAGVVVNVDAADGHLAGQFDQHSLGAVAVHLATGDGDVCGGGDVLTAALHHDAIAAVVVGDVIGHGEIVGAGDDVETVAVVVVGDVVFEGAVAEEVSNEAVQAVAVGHAVLDDHVDGLLVGVETVPGAILDLDAVEGNVGVVASFAGNVAVEPAVDLARSASRRKCST